MTGDIPDRLYGRYFAAGTSASFEAALEDRGDALAVVNSETGEELRVQFKELADRLGNVPRKIYFDDASVFECPDNDAVDLAFGKEQHFFNRLSKAEGSLKFAAVAFIITIGVLFGMYRFGLPALAHLASWATPSSAVALIDSQALTTVDSVFFKPSQMAESDQQKYTELFDELLDHSDVEKSSYQLLFRDGGRLGANAVALPGGTIILTDQLAKLAEKDDEIAGVLAHEIGHVKARHSLRQIYRALGIAFMAAVIIGDTSQLLDNVVAQVAVLDTLSYSRHFELHADSISVEIMHKVDRDPIAFVDLIDRVFKEAGADGNKTGWLSTHPGNADRRENAQQELKRLRN